MRKILDITPLRSLVAIADTGGFHRAAASLSLTQSAVSQHIRRLETVIGERLVERSGRVTHFTSTGETLLTEARQILAAHDLALVRLDVSRRAELIIGSTEHAADQIVAPVMAALDAELPRLEVQFRFDRARRLGEALEQGAIDMAITVTEPASPTGEMVGSLPLRWCASPNWRPPRDDQPWPLVAIQAPCSIRTTALELLSRNGTASRVVADAAYLSGVVDAARAGLGVALLAGVGAPPAGLVEVDHLPQAPPISLTARVRPGIDARAAALVRRAVRGALVRGFRPIPGGGPAGPPPEDSAAQNVAASITKR